MSGLVGVPAGRTCVARCSRRAARRSNPAVRPRTERPDGKGVAQRGHRCGGRRRVAARCVGCCAVARTSTAACLDDCSAHATDAPPIDGTPVVAPTAASAKLRSRKARARSRPTTARRWKAPADFQADCGAREANPDRRRTANQSCDIDRAACAANGWRRAIAVRQPAAVWRSRAIAVRGRAANARRRAARWRAARRRRRHGAAEGREWATRDGPGSTNAGRTRATCDRRCRPAGDSAGPEPVRSGLQRS